MPKKKNLGLKAGLMAVRGLMSPVQPLRFVGARAISTTSSTRVGVALWRGILREARVLDADPVRRSLLASPLLRAERSPTETPLPASVETNPSAEIMRIRWPYISPHH